MSTRPLIGITLDWQESGSYSKRPHYALRQHYFDAVWAAGGLPVGLPLVIECVPLYLAKIKGLLVPGGDYPSPDHWYSDKPGKAEHPRPDADVAIIQAALKLDKPLLCICAGMQALAVAQGGKLAWRIADQVKNPLPHRKIALEKHAHPVKLKKDSALRGIMAGAAKIETNSHHFEGVLKPGKALVCGKAPDGVIEAIEVPGKTFAIGVQWHPEMFREAESPDFRLFQAFVKAAAGK